MWCHSHGGSVVGVRRQHAKHGHQRCAGGGGVFDPLCCNSMVSLDTHACGAGRTPLHYAYNQLEVINECVSWMVEQVGAPVDYTGPVESDEPVPSNVHIHRFGDPLDEVRVQTSLLLVAG